jgi:hypothetical protein
MRYILLLIFLFSCEVGNAGWVNPKFDKYLAKFKEEARIRGVDWNPYNFDFIIEVSTSANIARTIHTFTGDRIGKTLINPDVFERQEFEIEFILFHEFGHLFYLFDHQDQNDFIMSATDKTFLGAWTMPAFRTIKLDYYFDKAKKLE